MFSSVSSSSFCYIPREVKSFVLFVLSLVFHLCLFASVMNTNCDVGSGFDDFKIERLVPVSLLACVLPWLPVDTLVHIFTQCTTLTGRQMTFILWYNSRHFNQALDLARPHPVDYLVCSTVSPEHCWFVFFEEEEIISNVNFSKSRVWKLKDWTSITSNDGLFQTVNDEDFWVKQELEWTGNKEIIIVWGCSLCSYM